MKRKSSCLLALLSLALLGGCKNVTSAVSSSSSSAANSSSSSTADSTSSSALSSSSSSVIPTVSLTVTVGEHATLGKIVAWTNDSTTAPEIGTEELTASAIKEKSSIAVSVTASEHYGIADQAEVVFGSAKACYNAEKKVFLLTLGTADATLDVSATVLLSKIKATVTVGDNAVLGAAYAWTNTDTTAPELGTDALDITSLVQEESIAITVTPSTHYTIADQAEVAFGSSKAVYNAAKKVFLLALEQDDITLDVSAAVTPIAKHSVKSVKNVCSRQIAVSGIAEKDQIEEGETVVITVSGTDSFGKKISHATRVYADINGVTYQASGKDNDPSVTITFTMPKADIDVIVSYSDDQVEDSKNGYTITADKNNTNAQLVGVMPGTKYVTLDSYIVVKEGYRISKVEYQNKGSSSWISGTSNNVRFSYQGDNIYTVRVEPETEDMAGTTTGLTADITLRITGANKNLHTITYTGLNAAFYDASKSQLPTSCYADDFVRLSVEGILDSKYLTAVITGVSATWSTDYASFTMPDGDVTVDFTFHDYLAPTFATNAGVKGSALYSSYSDAQYGNTPITKAKPGDTVYVAFTPNDGYSAKSIIVNGVSKEATGLYGNGKLYDYYASFPIADTATALNISFEVAKSYTLTIASGITNGKVTTNDEKLDVGEEGSVSIKPDLGYKLDTLTAKTDSGTDVAMTLADDKKSATFTMPDGNVTVSATFVVDPDFKAAQITYAIDSSSKSYFSSIEFRPEGLDKITWKSSTTATSFKMEAGKKLSITVNSSDFIGVQIDATVDGATTTVKSGDCDYTWSYYFSASIDKVEKDTTISIKKIATQGSDPGDGGDYYGD
jgi:hypothetical protein